MACPAAFASHSVWIDKHQYADAERKLHSKLNSNNTEVKIDSTEAEKSNSINALPADGQKTTHKKGKKQTAQNVAAEQVEEKKPSQPIQKCQKNEKNAKKKNSAKPNEVIDAVVAPAAVAAPTQDVATSKSKKSKSKKEKKAATAKQLKTENGKNIEHESTPPGLTDPSSENVAEQFFDKINSKDVALITSMESNKVHGSGGGAEDSTLVSEIAKVRQHLKNSLERMDDIALLASAPGRDVFDRVLALEKENQALRQLVQELKALSLRQDERIKSVESRLSRSSAEKSAHADVVPAIKKFDDEDDDGVDLFASDSEGEDDTAAKVREERLAAYAAKKSKKPALIAKSNIILDVKPWDDETDMKAMEAEVRKITSDGLLWRAAKLVPLAFGIHKLQISCVVEDDKVSVDWLIEEIEKNEDFVQSVDIAAFNKI